MKRKIKTALLSVYDKQGITAFAAELRKLDIEIISSGGTWKILDSEGISAEKVEDFTKYPEMFGGRVKTLHPRIHGGILARRNNDKDKLDMAENDIKPIDMVVVNLYPFRRVVENGSSAEKIIENIDIGGPSMLRSAAKNFKDVAVVTSPEDYLSLIEEMKENKGYITEKTRLELAKKAFAMTASYDAFISRYFSKLDKENGEPKSCEHEVLTLQFKRKDILRYGENPHQKAVYYEDMDQKENSLAGAVQLNGKKLSFNNIMDLDAARNIVMDFEMPASSVIKHTNPCGAAVGTSIREAFKKAHSTDPKSAYGSVVGFNRQVTADVAEDMRRLYIEAIVAPSFTDEALAVFKKKKNLRIIATGDCKTEDRTEKEFKKVSGGLLVEDKDLYIPKKSDFEVVTERAPSEDEYAALELGQRIVRHVKSNAVILTDKYKTVGIGAGQMSRVDALELAIKKSLSSTEGCIMASDAFFPFRDSIDEAFKAGITAVVQPGGSIRDTEVVEACNQHGISMVFTGKRCFRHL